MSEGKIPDERPSIPPEKNAGLVPIGSLPPRRDGARKVIAKEIPIEPNPDSKFTVAQNRSSVGLPIIGVLVLVAGLAASGLYFYIANDRESSNTNAAVISSIPNAPPPPSTSDPALSKDIADSNSLSALPTSSGAPRKIISGPVGYALLIGQSNVDRARARLSPPYAEPANPRVEIWNRRTKRFEIWDPSKSSPPQHLDLDTSIGPRNLWPRVLAGKIANVDKPIKVIAATRSGQGLNQWIANENGGTGQMWRRLVQQMTESGIKRFDYLFFDQGETSALGFDSQTGALSVFYKQLRTTGLISDQTICFSREVRRPAESIKAAHFVFEQIHKNGFVVPNKGMIYDVNGIGSRSGMPNPRDLHIVGESHDVVAERAFSWFMGR